MSTIKTGVFKGHEFSDVMDFITWNHEKNVDGFEFLEEDLEWVDDHGWAQYSVYFKDLKTNKCYGTWYQVQPEWGVYYEDEGLDIITDRIFEVVPKQVTKTIYEVVRK